MLASALANVEPAGVRGRPVDLIRMWAEELETSHAATYGTYEMTREYLFVRAEAEGGRHVSTAMNFMHAHRGQPIDWEVRLHRRYYEGGDSRTAAAMIRKLTSARTRDVTTQPLTELIMSRLPQTTLQRTIDAMSEGEATGFGR